MVEMDVEFIVSELPRARPHVAISERGQESESDRLEREVIKLAKAWKVKTDDGDNEKWSNHYVAMCKAIDALITFESNPTEEGNETKHPNS